MESLPPSLEDKLKRLLNPHLQQSSSSANSAKIQKVPPYLRERPEYEKYYSPKVVSIGPIHYPKGEDRKKIWASHYLKDKLGLKEEYAQRRPLEKILSRIQELKSLYSEDVIQGFIGAGGNDEELAWILFVDGCAALHVMHEAVEGQSKLQALYIIVEQDLLLLENQLPYQVLRMLSKKEGDGDSELQNLVSRFMNRFIQTCSNGVNLRTNHQHSAHLLDVLITSMLNKREHGERVIDVQPPLSKKPSPKRRSIHELISAGIKIKKDDKQNLTGISLRGRTLYIPPFKVDDFTVQNFLNMIAYEMCPDNSKSDYEISNYISFLNSLIDIPEDVKALKKADVLENILGSEEEVARIFNTEITYLVLDTGIYEPVKDELEGICSHKWRTWLSDLLNVKNWLTEFQHKHFNTPWKIIGLISFILGFILTAINIRKELSSKHGSSH